MTGREIRPLFLAMYFMGFSLLKDRRTKFSRPLCLSMARDFSSEFIIAFRDCWAKQEADSRPCSRIEFKFAASVKWKSTEMLFVRRTSMLASLGSILASRTLALVGARTGAGASIFVAEMSTSSDLIQVLCLCARKIA